MTVYFVYSPTGHVKIGYTSHTNPASRLEALQTAHQYELSLLAHCDGEQEDERGLHYTFESEHERGEWFRLSDRLASLIGYVKTFKTIHGWDVAHIDPKLFDAHMRVTPLAESLRAAERLAQTEETWIRRAKELDSDDRLPSSMREPDCWQDVMSTWSGVSDFRDDIRYFTVPSQPRYKIVWEPLEESEDIDGHSNPAGLEHTANRLLEVSDKNQLVAFWILAVTRDISWQHERYLPRLLKRIPGLQWLLTECRKYCSAYWPSTCSSVLPIYASVPGCCLLTGNEYIDICAQARARIWRKYRLTRFFKENDYCPFPKRYGPSFLNQEPHPDRPRIIPPLNTWASSLPFSE